MRKKIIAGNWKMHTTIEEGLKLASEVFHMVEAEVNHPQIRVIMAPPFTHLDALSRRKPARQNLALAAQNCSAEEQGAFTGEVSAKMIQSLAVEFVILGHSERRSLYGEDDATVAAKVRAALAEELKPILCVGEELESREKGEQEAVVGGQLGAALEGLSADDFKHIVIAYEPVWAIGTGKTASPEQAQEMHAFIRAQLRETFGAEAAEQTSILYGGSCKPDNAAQIFAGPDVDGGLIGGASLKSRDFLSIVHAMQKQVQHG
jgi:triosephosphate isomerase